MVRWGWEESGRAGAGYSRGKLIRVITYNRQSPTLTPWGIVNTFYSRRFPRVSLQTLGLNAPVHLQTRVSPGYFCIQYPAVNPYLASCISARAAPPPPPKRSGQVPCHGPGAFLGGLGRLAVGKSNSLGESALEVAQQGRAGTGKVLG